MTQADRRPARVPSPGRLLVTVLAITFIAEAAVMLLLPGRHSVAESIADAALLVVFSAPFLWWLVVRPLRTTAMTEHVRAATVIRHALDGIITINEQGLVESFNPAAERIFGVTKEEMLGKPLTLLIPARFRDAHQQGLERLRSGGEPHILGKTVELHGLRSDGSEFPLELSLARWEAGQGTFYTGMVRDIGERKRMEETRQALYRASLHIQEQLGLRDRLNRLLEGAREILHLDRFIVLLADPAERWLEAVASTGTSEPLEALRVPIGPEGGGLAQAYLTKELILWDGLASVPEALRLQPPYDQIKAFRSRAFANVPLVVQGRAIGVLVVDRKHSRRPLEPATLELL